LKIMAVRRQNEVMRPPGRTGMEFGMDLEIAEV
jgi:hypothetical protein